MNNASSQSQKVELLAPAKDKQCAIAAINAGADAVYIGASSFGARKKASNSIEDIKEITDYAHKFNVKIYVTVNTILYDNELKSAQKLINDLYEANVDAIIIQDMGLLKLDIPPVALHASTQCNIDTLEKVKFIESCNIERVVLPREFSIKEIQNIKKNSDIELEVFIHGALCTCCSGQCYLSASIGGRSANRGDCAQTCRKKYTVVDEKGKKLADSKYLLSMKDLSMAEHLEELINAGVTSLKIEGRLKDEDYVKNVVSYYRKKIDEVNPLLRPSNGEIKTNFIPDINKTFNRGYTDFNAKGTCKDLINPDTPKFTGEKIGKIKNIKGPVVEIETKIKLNAEDGICFFDKKGELQGTNIIKTDKNSVTLRTPKGLEKDMMLYRNYDAEFAKRLKEAEFTRKLPLQITVTKNNDGFWVNLNNEYTYSVTDAFETAQNAEKARENLISQFSKTKDSEFTVKKITPDKDFDLFIPVSKLNEIRRNFLKEYSTYRNVEFKRNKREKVFTASMFPVQELDYTFNVSNEKAKTFYEEAGAKVKELAFETGVSGNQLVITKNCIRRNLGICLKEKNGKNEHSKLYLFDEYGKKYNLEFDCKVCKMKICKN